MKQVEELILNGKTHREINRLTGVSLGKISNIRQGMRITNVETAAVVNDMHSIFVDKEAWSLCLKIIKDVSPEKVIIAGDGYDCCAISKYDKDPGRVDQNRLQGELDYGFDVILKPLREAVPSAQIIYIGGNHEDRLRKMIWNNPSLHGLRAIELPILFRLNELNIEYIPYPKVYWLGSMCVYHGTSLSKYASYTARAELERNGCSGMSGHTHRGGKYPKRDRSGYYFWYENYCLCNLEPGYINGTANWCQGFSFVTVAGGRPYVEPVEIINGMAIYGGKVYQV